MAFGCLRSQRPGYFDDVLVPVHTIGTRARLRSAEHGDIAVPRSCTVRFGQRSFRLSAPCAKTFRLNWRTATLVHSVLNLALSHGVLSVPTRNRRLCELLFKRPYTSLNLRFDWLIDWFDWLIDTYWTYDYNPRVVYVSSTRLSVIVKKIPSPRRVCMHAYRSNAPDTRSRNLYKKLTQVELHKKPARLSRFLAQVFFIVQVTCARCTRSKKAW